jgi:hypothetical protein
LSGSEAEQPGDEESLANGIFFCQPPHSAFPNHVPLASHTRFLTVRWSCSITLLTRRQPNAPELNKRCRPHLKPTNKSYRIDETYIKVKALFRFPVLSARRFIPSSFTYTPSLQCCAARAPGWTTTDPV